MFFKIRIKKLRLIVTNEKVKRRSKRDMFAQAQKDLKRELITKRGEKCEICGSVEHIELHHINPISEGGANSRSNSMLVCSKCHQKLHNNPYFSISIYEKRKSTYSIEQLKNNAKYFFSFR